MNKTFKFGKIDYYDVGDPVSDFEVEVDFEDGVFSASATVWDSTHKRTLICGQCVELIEKYLPDNALAKKILRLWQLYHFNDLHAGTPAQEAAVEAWLKESGKSYSYTEAKAYLQSIGLYEVSAAEADPYRKLKCNLGKPFRYGYEWLFWEIPSADRAEIESLFKEATE